LVILAAVLAFALAACVPPTINPSINLQLTPPAPREEGFTVSLQTTATGGAADVGSATYTRFLNDRQLAGKRDTLTLTFHNTGTFEVTVAATNAVGVMATDSVSITVEDEAVDSV